MNDDFHELTADEWKEWENAAGGRFQVGAACPSLSRLFELADAEARSTPLTCAQQDILLHLCDCPVCRRTHRAALGVAREVQTDEQVDTFVDGALAEPLDEEEASQFSSISDQEPMVLPFAIDEQERQGATPECEPGTIVVISATDWISTAQVASAATASCQATIPMKRFPEPVRRRLPWIQELQLTCLPDQHDSRVAKYNAQVLVKAGAIGGTVRVVLEWPDHSRGRTTLSSDCEYRNWLDNGRLPCDRSCIAIHVV